MSRAAAVTLLLVTAALTGCASIPAEVSRLDDNATAVEIESTPFYPQERFQCGPAALTTVLAHSGVDVALDKITELTYIPGRQGSLQTELVSTARSFDRIPYPLDGTLAALHEELLAGRPVLVLQNLAIRWAPQWHYAVVVGIDLTEDTVVLRSATDRRRITKLRTFLHTWRRGGYWAISLLQPGDIPANANKRRYFQAVADIEASGRTESAKTAWDAALQRWPDERTALFGVASTAFQLGDLDVAERNYRKLLAIDPDFHAARNNLAYTLAARGEIEEAVEQIQTILSRLDDNDPFRAEYDASLNELSSPH